MEVGLKILRTIEWSNSNIPGKSTKKKAKTHKTKIRTNKFPENNETTAGKPQVPGGPARRKQTFQFNCYLLYVVVPHN